MSQQHATGLPNNDALSERTYFETKKFKLKQVRTELAVLKSGLLYLGLGNASFTNALFGQLTQQAPFTLFSVPESQELLLSEFEKHELRKHREFELATLEQEIIDLQFALALHFNELVVQVHAAYNDYQKLSDQLNVAVKAWNSLSNRNSLTKAKALQGYESDYLEKYLVDILADRVGELKRVVEYYSACANNTFCKESTNIAEKIDGLKALVKEHEEYVCSHKQRIKKNIAISARACAEHGINVAAIHKKTQSFYETKKKSAAAQALKDAEDKKQKHSSSGGGPKKDDEDEKRRKGNVVHNMQDFFKKTPLGLLIKDYVEKTKKYVQGQSVYKMMKDVGDYLKKGDQLYLDSLHKDHLEVFRKDNKFKTVLDFCGKEIVAKARKAEGRRL
jgi:hypothetical protein